MTNNYSDFIGKIDVDKVILELQDYLETLKKLFVVKSGSYDRLDEYEFPKMEFIHDKLKKYKFANGKPEKNTIELNPMATFWWCMYDSMSNTIHTFPFLHHHSSSWERQQVDLFIVNCIINELKDVHLDENLIKLKSSFVVKNGHRYKVKYVHDYSPIGCKNQLLIIKTTTKELIYCTTEYFNEKIY